jgi:hypothetical protein
MMLHRSTRPLLNSVVGRQLVSRARCDAPLKAWAAARTDELPLNRPNVRTVVTTTQFGLPEPSKCATKQISTKPMSESQLADHSWRQMNHIWSEEEIQGCIASKDQKHKPVTVSDKLAHSFMRTLYHTFNFITGYKHDNPPTKSIEWRLIVLESFAGVPGFLAAGFRHFYSLRTLQRDHGAIFTFLEEAENERMHLLVCLKMFEANRITKALVVTAQISMTPFLAAVYAVHPPTVHRFVGYLEETAVETYANVIAHVDKPGTHLHRDWAHLAAPDVAKSYWALEPGATWRETLGHILADEAHHRDVNHTFAELGPEADNPFVQEHIANFDAAVARRAPALLKEALTK